MEKFINADPRQTLLLPVDLREWVPDDDTICKFRRENETAFAESFLQVLLLAKELKLLRVGMVSVDGTKLDANASKRRSIRYDRTGELIERLRVDIAELLKQAEGEDASGSADPQKLPKEIARREKLQAKLSEAQARLEAAARDRAAAGQPAYEAKVAAREARSGRRKAKKPKPPDDTPEPSEQTNLTDPDSRLMRRSRQHEYRQAYNGPGRGRRHSADSECGR